jgi:rSAM/selenodomain-associated transferase 2
MRISVIIPTLNEAARIAGAIRSLREQQPHEIIVVDGGSADASLTLAGDADLVLEASRGRARQMNAGAVRATGDILLFLHADCTLEAGALKEVDCLLTNPDVLAGCFSMKVQSPGCLYRSIDACAAARVRLTGLIYGDQGLFLRRVDFEKLGGFPDLAFMEDVFFSRRLSRLGRVIVARRRILVSPRRWQHAGLVRQTLRNWLLTGLAAGGVHPDRLGLYPLVR